MCDCSEERDRRARARAARRLRLYGSESGENEGFYGPDGELLVGPNGELLGPDGTPLLGPNGELLYGPDGPKSRFTPVHLVLGSVSFLFALMALIFKTVDKDALYATLSKIGLGNLFKGNLFKGNLFKGNLYKGSDGKDGCLDPKKKKWPPPTCAPKPCPR